jgi:hypothetical protein
MSDTDPDGPLTKAWKDWVASGGNLNQSLTLAPEKVQAYVQTLTLEKQLEESLWAVGSGPITATESVVRQHTPHFKGSTERIRKVAHDTVAILCPCRAILVFWRCGYVYDGYERTPQAFNAGIDFKPAKGDRCEEEISERRHLNVNNRCVWHD